MRHLWAIQEYTWSVQCVLWQTVAPISWSKRMFLHINKTLTGFHYPLFSLHADRKREASPYLWSAKNSLIDYSCSAWWENLVMTGRGWWTGAPGVMTALVLLPSLTTGKRAGNYVRRSYERETQRGWQPRQLCWRLQTCNWQACPLPPSPSPPTQLPPHCVSLPHSPTMELALFVSVFHMDAGYTVNSSSAWEKHPIEHFSD